MNRKDLRLFAMAVKKRWNISEEQMQAGIQCMCDVMKDCEASPRDKVTAFRALIEAEAQNQSDEHLEAKSEGNRLLALLESARARGSVAGIADGAPGDCSPVAIESAAD
jgi:hypothetical protein